jgi:hypothetical protein
VQLLDDDGRSLDARYFMEPDGPYIALVVESRSGVSGSRPPRNPDYNQALMLLLARLGQLNALLVDALVDSRHVRDLGVPEADRRLILTPIRLALEPDMAALRRRMGTAQAKIAQAPGATKGGNATKRIRLRLQVPRYQPSDAGHLAATLAAPISAPMSAFILAWHPLHYRWEERGYDEAIEVTAAGRIWREDWTVGVRKGGIRPGDRAMLYRQHQQRGLVASGIFASGVETGEHWDGSGRQARYGQIDWDTVLSYGDRLPVEELRVEVPEVKWDHIQGSGIEVPSAAVRKLSDLWDRHVSQYRRAVTVDLAASQEERVLGGQTYSRFGHEQTLTAERGGASIAAAPPAWLTLPEQEFQERYRPARNATSSYLHRALLRALGPTATRVPTDQELSRKPLLLDLVSPLPSRLRCYLYEATQHASERQQGTFKVQLTVGVPHPEVNSGRLYFDRSDSIRPVLMGYHPDWRIFILWDADLHDLGDGFPYSKNVQAPPDVVWGALARGLAQGSRRLRRPPTTEAIVAARPSRLAEALKLRIRLSIQALCEGIF